MTLKVGFQALFFLLIKIVDDVKAAIFHEKTRELSRPQFGSDFFLIWDFSTNSHY